MRLNESIVVSARPQLVWDFIAEPANALNYFSGITRWEVQGEQRTGLGARYRMLMRVGAAEMGGLVEIVEFSAPLDMAWSSVTGVDQRGRWRLRKAGARGTRVEFRFAYGVAGAGIMGYISERVSAPAVRRHLRRTLQQLKREVEREQLREDGARRKAEREAATA
jgi:carbon monoxide dehydrogenase subunit G